METNTLISLDNLAAVLQAYAEEVRELYKKNLVESDRLATEKLLNSIETEVVRDGSAYLVTMTLEDYWKYVEYDTKPHWPPPAALLKWITVKPVLPHPDKNGRLPKPEQLAFLIGRAMAGLSPNQEKCKNPHGGTTGTHDLQDAVTNCNRKYEQLIAEALAKDLGEGFHAMILEMLSFKR